ncbi:MAG: COP23 domain-containing protein [Cyanobacteria bacterium P01_A01_bin.105]
MHSNAFASHTDLHDVTFSCQGHRLYASSAHATTQIATFSHAGGYSGSERCVIIRGNMQSANHSHRLNFITYGYRNGYPVICGVSGFGQNCNSGAYLFTLARRRTSPRTAVLRFLYRLNTGNTDGYVLYDNDSRIYVDFNEYVSNAFNDGNVTDNVAGVGTVSPASPAPATLPGVTLPGSQPEVTEPDADWGGGQVFPGGESVF